MAKADRAARVRPRNTRYLLDAATRFSWSGPGGYYAVEYIGNIDRWQIVDRDGEVLGNEPGDKRDAAIEHAIALAEGR